MHLAPTVAMPKAVTEGTGVTARQQVAEGGLKAGGMLKNKKVDKAYYFL